jgi:signal transduction histidine kinase
MPTAAAGIGSELQPVRVRGDERRLAEVFRNLLNKAARHAKSTIKIRWSAVPVKRWSRWTTRRDHLPSRLRSVFERFARLDRGRLEAYSHRLAMSGLAWKSKCQALLATLRCS